MKTIEKDVLEWFSVNEKILLDSVRALHEEAIEDLLDDRDSQPFDGAWVAADKALQQHKAQLTPAQATTLAAYADKIRQSFYLAVIKATGSPDLAAYVSDDVELIFDTLATCYINEFVFSMMNNYLSGKVPGNQMTYIKDNPSGLY